jgi:hypothetical protein
MVQVTAAPSSLDVVTVPDFEGSGRDRYELRALLFLGCWTEFAGAARAFPLHLACIGEPPVSVRWLAARCGARTEVFAPLANDGWRGLNKLRGLERASKASQRLLLDTDVLVLSDFSRIISDAPGLAAAAAFRQRVPAGAWPAIYAALGVPLPPDRPYFNGGVVVVPVSSSLRELWESYARGIASAFASDPDVDRTLIESDQTSLAPAIAALQASGVPFSTLPPHYNAGWPHLYRRAPGLADVVLFHAVGLFGKTYRADRSVTWNVDRYCFELIRRVVTAWRTDPDGAMRPRTAVTRLLPSAGDVWRLRQRLQHVCRTHVIPALQAGGR